MNRHRVLELLKRLLPTGKQAASPAVAASYTPEELVKALGVEVVERKDKQTYYVAYQGGYFILSFMENGEWLDLFYTRFEQCGMEYIHELALTCNSINCRFAGWTCYSHASKEDESDEPFHVSLSYRFPIQGELACHVALLKNVMAQAFHIARDFTEELKRAIQQHDHAEEQLVDTLFGQKLESARRMLELGHLLPKQDTPGEEHPATEELSVGQLIKLFGAVDWGCLQEMQIVCDGRVERIEEVAAITAFNLRNYLKAHPEPQQVKQLTLLVRFENQSLVISLTQASRGNTETTLFYHANVMRTGSQGDQFTDMRSAVHFRAMMEVRLTDDEAAYWEAKFMMDDAHDKLENGKANELTDEQRFLLSHTDAHIQSDLYWGKKFYNLGCHFQALYHFNRLFRFLGSTWSQLHEEQRNLYEQLAFYLGTIYMSLGMHDRAFYYLHTAKQHNNLMAIQEFTNCLCHLEDPVATDYLYTMQAAARDYLNKGEEPVAPMQAFYRFLNRRLAFLLIDRHAYDEAEALLNRMIAQGEDVEFAKNELEYLKKRREDEATSSN